MKDNKKISETIPETSISSKNSGFGRRLFANFLDNLILLVLTIPIQILTGINVVESIFDNKIFMQVNIAWGIIGAIYYIGFWTLGNGMTPGKRLFGIKIVGLSGEKLGLGKSIIRYLGYYLSSISLFLGFLWVIWDKEKRGWHDKIAGTKVVIVDENPKFIHGLVVFIAYLIFFVYVFSVGLIGALMKYQTQKLHQSSVNVRQQEISSQPQMIETMCWINIPLPRRVNGNRSWDFERISSPNIKFDIIKPGEMFIVNPDFIKVHFKEKGPNFEGTPGVDVRCTYNGEGWDLEDFKKSVGNDPKISILSSSETIIAGKKAYKMELKGISYLENYILLSPDESQIIHIGIIPPMDNDELKNEILEDIKYIIENIQPSSK